MRRIKRFSSKKNEFLFRAAAILLPLISIVLLLSQTAFAQNTYVITDGERILIHTTSASDPAEVLDEAGLTLGADDTYTTQGGGGVSEITVRRNLSVYIDNCGKIMNVDVSAGTVKELLKQLSIALDQNTTVSVSLDAMVYDGMEIIVTRTVHTTEVYTMKVKVAESENGYAYVLTSADGSFRITLYSGSKGQYSWLAQYIGQEITVEVAACNWNSKGYKGCVLAIVLPDGTKIINTLNFND